MLKSLKEVFPIIKWLPSYKPSWMIHDLIAGIAGLPPIYGLYSSVLCGIVYSLFGSSKDVTTGPTAILSIMLGQALLSLDDDFVKKYSPTLVASTLALLNGISMLVISILRLGFLVDFISPSVIIGFSAGAATTIIISQIPGVFGIAKVSTVPYIAIGEIIGLLPTARFTDAMFGFITIVFLVGVDFLKRRNLGSKLYSGLALFKNGIVLIISTFAAYFVVNYSESKLNIIGQIPSGYPPLQTPLINATAFSKLFSLSLAITIVGIVEQIAVGKALAKKNNYILKANSELMALGFINVLNAFFLGFPVTGSMSRSIIQSDSGVKTPMGGFVASLIILCSLYFLTPLFYYIPKSALAALIMVACKNLFISFEDLKHRFKVDLVDSLFILISFLVVFFTSVEIGIGVAAGLSILKLIYPIARPQVPVTMVSLKDNREAFLVTFDHDLIFPNAEYVEECILERIFELKYKNLMAAKGYLSSDEERTVLKRKFAETIVLLNCHGVSRIDNEGLRTLVNLRRSLKKKVTRPVPQDPALSPLQVKPDELSFRLFGLTEEVKTYILSKRELVGLIIEDHTAVPEIGINIMEENIQVEDAEALPSYHIYATMEDARV